MDPKTKPPGQVDPATLNKINRKKVERQTQAVTREKKQDKPEAPRTS